MRRKRRKYRTRKYKRRGKALRAQTHAQHRRATATAILANTSVNNFAKTEREIYLEKELNQTRKTLKKVKNRHTTYLGTRSKRNRSNPLIIQAFNDKIGELRENKNNIKQQLNSLK